MFCFIKKKKHLEEIKRTYKDGRLNTSSVISNAVDGNETEEFADRKGQVNFQNFHE